MYQCRHYVILVSIVWLSASLGQVVRNEDICGPYNGRRLYVELGEQGVLYASNVTLLKKSTSKVVYSNSGSGANSSHDQCSLELVTCPSCVINLTFKSINLLHHCDDGSTTIDSPCRCDYVWISEPPYEDVSGMPFCGHYSPISYRSNTRTVSIALLYSQAHNHAFYLEYTAERNRLILNGSDSQSERSKSMNSTGGGGILTSPFFPSRYPRDLGMEYIITCPSEAPSCRVRVLFSDFQLAAVSIMEVYDWNGQRLDVSSGARFRPPIIVSTGPSLLIRFYANGGTGLGYKAFYSFVPVHLYDKHSHPITDCGGYVENLGGTITMMDMVGEGVKTYDCVWLIRPRKNFLHMKTHMYLKVITFAEMAGNTELIVKQGPTSALMPLEVLRHPVSQLQPPRLKEHLSPVNSGFHVSLRGSFGPNSRLAIAYTAFSYTDCFAGSDFLCQNHRCISSQLNCDGFDHCGDNSDEPSSCLHEWDSIGLPDRKWQQNKANYYFPKIDRYPDLKTATLVFVASSLGLIILITALIILLYRVGARARQQRELQSRLRTISELLDGARIDEITVSDDPPVYEAPPNYDEVIKLGLEDETLEAAPSSSNNSNTRRKKQRTRRDDRRSRSIPPSQCSCECEQQLTLNICVDATSTNRSENITPISNKSMDECITPPPPYLTPRTSNREIFSFDPDPQLPQDSVPVRAPPIARCDTIKINDDNNSDTGTDSPVPDVSPEQQQQQEQEQQQTHQSRCRRSSSTSRSLPVSRASSSSPLPSPKKADRKGIPSVSAEQLPAVENTGSALGAYLRAVAEASSRFTSQASTYCPVQSVKSSVVCRSTNNVSANNCATVEVENSPLDQDVGHAGNEIDSQPTDDLCSCEGACGCASAMLLDSTESQALVARSNSLVEPASGSNVVTGLLVRNRYSNNSSRNSSPAPRKMYGSFERLGREIDVDIDVISETTSILGPGTLANTPRATPNRLMRRISTYDLDNLYESIRVLDSFLAQRGSSRRDDLFSTREVAGGTRIRRSRPSMGLMFFGSPKQRKCRPSDNNSSVSTTRTSSISNIRVWRSIDDNLPE